MDNLQDLLEEQDKLQVLTNEEEKEVEVKEDESVVESTEEMETNTEEDAQILAEAKARFKEITGLDEELPDLNLDTIANIVKNKLDTVVKSYNDPEIDKLVEWKAKGNSIDTYFQAPKIFDKTSIDIEKDGDLIISTVLERKGLSKEEIADNLELLNLDADKKTRRINEYIDILEKASKLEYDNYVANIEKENQDAIKKATEIEQIINSNTIGLVNIPKDEIDPFMKYLNSDEYNNKWKSLTSQQLAFIEYLVYKDCNIKTATTSQSMNRKSVQVVVKNQPQNTGNDINEQLELLNRFK